MKSVARLLLIMLLALGLSLVSVGFSAADPGDSGDTPVDPADPGGIPGGSPGESNPAPPGVSVPRVMLKAFTTDPSPVVAGQDFTVNFTLHNTSQRTYVRNVKVTLASTDAAFMPATGSSSIYIHQINLGDVATGTMTFHSLPNLDEKPYQMTLTTEYEDRQVNGYSATETVSVAVTQSARAEASVPQLMPSPVTVGQDASLSFSVHNQGKTKLYNVKASIAEGQPLIGQEVFVGTIEPGTSGAVDMTVHAESEVSGPAEITVSYEDVNGKTSTLTQTVEVMVMPPMEQGPTDPMEEYPQQGSSLGWLMLIAVLVAIALVSVAIALLVRRSRLRRAEQEEAESLAILDGEPLVPTDEQ